jgi:hypothetical protein
MMRDLRLAVRWRIQMSWPGYNPRFFGDFDSEVEAQRWIKKQARSVHKAVGRAS